MNLQVPASRLTSYTATRRAKRLEREQDGCQDEEDSTDQSGSRSPVATTSM